MDMHSIDCLLREFLLSCCLTCHDRLVEEIEAFGAYDSAQLPNLAKCLQLPPNLPQMSISAILCIQISYHSPNKTLGERSVAEELFVPVVCVLSL